VKTGTKADFNFVVQAVRQNQPHKDKVKAIQRSTVQKAVTKIPLFPFFIIVTQNEKKVKKKQPNFFVCF
jgi:hypothetical protein